MYPEKFKWLKVQKVTLIFNENFKPEIMGLGVQEKELVKPTSELGFLIFPSNPTLLYTSGPVIVRTFTWLGGLPLKFHDFGEGADSVESGSKAS